MAEIGTFTRTETGYAGELHSFGLHEKLFIVPAKLFRSNDDPSVWTLRWKHHRKVEDEE